MTISIISLNLQQPDSDPQDNFKSIINVGNHIHIKQYRIILPLIPRILPQWNNRDKYKFTSAEFFRSSVASAFAAAVPSGIASFKNLQYKDTTFQKSDD